MLSDVSPDASTTYTLRDRAVMDYSTTQFNINKHPIPHPNNINILKNNTANPYPSPRVKPWNYFGIAHAVGHDKKRILLPGVPTGSTRPGVPTDCYFEHNHSMTGAGIIRT